MPSQRGTTKLERFPLIFSAVCPCPISASLALPVRSLGEHVDDMQGVGYWTHFGPLVQVTVFDGANRQGKYLA